MSLNPDFLNELKKRFSGDLRLDAASRALYSTDASIYQIEPLGVAIPKTQDDLHSAVELAARYRIPILPRGSGSSLAGQAVGEALILDCSRWLDDIVAIDPQSGTATVEPGVILSDLNRAAAKHGLMFGPDPASAERATMGGVIGNNATGAHSILYGMSADHLISADVIRADGSLETWAENGVSTLLATAEELRSRYGDAIKRNHPKSWRNSAGYRLNYLLPWSPASPPQWADDFYPPVKDHINLAHLLAGSEGTLAVMRRASVNLVRKPNHTILGVLAYESIVQACEDVPRLLEFKPSAVELIPRLVLRLARGVPAYARQMGWVIGDPAAVLVVEFSGEQPLALKDAVRRIGDLLTVAESPEDQARIWSVRKMGLGILDSRRQSARPVAFIEDCAVPVERLGGFVHEVERILSDHRVDGGIYAHASGGCLHIRPILDLKTSQGVSSLRSIAEQVLALTLSLGGSMSSEHGDGIARGEWIEKTYGAEVTEAMRLLKRAADPDNLLNPGKLFDAPRMDSHLRPDTPYQSGLWTSELRFDHQHGLAGAIEQCNGQGVCRKSDGVMCPSFQATRDEGNSTRGRANLLRALITRRPAIQDNMLSATYSALDLCLACKGCTSECPSGVDMPKLKYEFMNQYYKTHRRQLRDYLFGYFHVVSKWVAPFASVINVMMRVDWARRWVAHMAGITDQRAFPAYGMKNPVRRMKTRTGRAVIFLTDVFSRYLEPEVEYAACEVLDALGYEVMILPIVGAGASLLSKGFISAARRHAEKVLEEIERLGAGAGLSVVGCEPPEIYCLKHEYSSLLPGRRAEIESISRRTWLLDEFLVRSGGLSGLRVVNLDKPQKLTFHPHCHQRAEGLAEDGRPSGTSATVEMLRVFGYDVDVMDSGCCGMAGTFGYDAEHYELSMQIGELSVLPKARLAGHMISTGSACRIQIRHGAGKEAIHPVVLIARSLQVRR